ncbi:hypothetical protein MVEN_02269700 [Mycena venus]|uniref:Uncharacterized protein n=1 Tax=Mycena venus TaxID=2733690 RepID=A0A8H7CEL4_9AGAR|nr:hypothetical protein MVEN_02269700 [Mycena venus]
MLSKILVTGLCSLFALQAVTASQLQTPLDASHGSRIEPALQSGFYEIHNKAYDGQLAAFHRDELIVVLNNATVPKKPNFGKWKVKEVAPELYSISNVGLGLGLSFNADNFITAETSDVLFNIKDAGNKTFEISLNPEGLEEDEDQLFWTQYSFCEAEVHLDPAFDGEEQMLQRWEFRPWSL